MYLESITQILKNYAALYLFLHQPNGTKAKPAIDMKHSLITAYCVSFWERLTLWKHVALTSSNVVFNCVVNDHRISIDTVPIAKHRRQPMQMCCTLFCVFECPGECVVHSVNLFGLYRMMTIISVWTQHALNDVKVIVGKKQLLSLMAD